MSNFMRFVTAEAQDSIVQQIPYSPDSSFVGRSSVFARLHEIINTSGSHNRVALYGLGGIG